MATQASTALNAAQHALRILQNAGGLVPGLGPVAAAALALIESAQAAEKNRAEFEGMAEACCVIIETLNNRVPNLGGLGTSDDTQLQQDANKLLQEMRLIEDCIRKYGRPSLIRRIFNHNADQEAIKQCQDRLQRAPNLFILQASIELRTTVSEILSRTTQSPEGNLMVSAAQPTSERSQERAERRRLKHSMRMNRIRRGEDSE